MEPKPGTIFYQVEDGHIHKYRFIEQRIPKGASVPHWRFYEVNQNRWFFVTADTTDYFLTEAEAWQSYRSQHLLAIENFGKHIQELLEMQLESIREVERIGEILTSL